MVYKAPLKINLGALESMQKSRIQEMFGGTLGISPYIVLSAHLYIYLLPSRPSKQRFHMVIIW